VGFNIKFIKVVFFVIVMGLVIKNNVKKGTELAVSDEFLVEMEKRVEDMMKKAEERARANFRRTLFARDL
jgi:hypothetical protein